MMDADENDLDGLFEEYDNRHEEHADNSDNGDANPSKPTENAEKVAAPRRAVRNPRLKFNAERLCGERGIPVVVKHFQDVKFKGKGHEVEDLNKLLSTLEHWCHRLYPSMKFGDCLRQIEKLGKKRPVQTCLRKIRLDMPILNDDFVRDEPEDDENQPDVDIPPQDAFDRLISEIQENSNAQLASTPLPVKTSAPGQKLGSFGSTLTEEQRKRMEYNKMLAAERRKARFLASQSATVASNDSEDLFARVSAPAVHSSTNYGETNSASEDIFTESPSLLSQEADKLQSVLTDNCSEELELDDLVDLVDENEEHSSSVIGKEDNNPKISAQVNGQKHFIDLSYEGGSEKTVKNYAEIADLEKEVSGVVGKNGTIEIVNLESKSNHNDPIAVVDLERETPAESNYPAPVVILEDEEFVDELELDDLVNLVDEDEEHSSSVIRKEDYNPEISAQLNGHKHFIDLSCEGGREKTVKNYTEIVDLEKEVAGVVGKNGTIEIVNLESKSNRNEPIAVVDLEGKMSAKTNNPAQVVILEDEEFVDLTNEKVVADSNLNEELESTISTSSTGEQKNLEVFDKTPVSRNTCKTFQAEVETMEVD